jgi:hypothetical protein
VASRLPRTGAAMSGHFSAVSQQLFSRQHRADLGSDASRGDPRPGSCRSRRGGGRPGAIAQAARPRPSGVAVAPAAAIDHLSLPFARRLSAGGRAPPRGLLQRLAALPGDLLPPRPARERDQLHGQQVRRRCRLDRARRLDRGRAPGPGVDRPVGRRLWGDGHRPAQRERVWRGSPRSSGSTWGARTHASETPTTTSNEALNKAHVPHLFRTYPSGHSGALWRGQAMRWLDYALDALARGA